ncbi:hypothetical protein E2C01_019650 [Portunus trituberculatus]|uniref:Uncharacterized protein n=1 Tax=Portunus trituberculatus TaxID=210409 RepID=A0A5B7DYI3_PORTR|nr:hypothetical protein [Portunus trituberculatus]
MPRVTGPLLVSRARGAIYPRHARPDTVLEGLGSIVLRFRPAGSIHFPLRKRISEYMSQYSPRAAEGD